MSEKKWFIYVVDHHEGPFTVDEIWSGIDSGKYPQSGFVWADGMKDWVGLSTLPEFERSAPPIAAEPPIESPAGSPAESPTGTTEVSVESNGQSVQAAATTVATAAEPVREPTLTGSVRESTATIETGGRTSII